jgi:hypothetical protein
MLSSHMYQFLRLCVVKTVDIVRITRIVLFQLSVRLCYINRVLLVSW